jgi:hypothetical protein
MKGNLLKEEVVVNIFQPLTLEARRCISRPASFTSRGGVTGIELPSQPGFAESFPNHAMSDLYFSRLRNEFGRVQFVSAVAR